MDAPTLFIVTGQFLQPAEVYAPFTPRHRAWLDEHYRSGQFLLSSRRLSGQGGILLVRAERQAGLERLFASDPFVTQGCASSSDQGFAPGKRGEGQETGGVDVVKSPHRQLLHWWATINATARFCNPDGWGRHGHATGARSAWRQGLFGNEPVKFSIRPCTNRSSSGSRENQRR